MHLKYVTQSLRLPWTASPSLTVGDVHVGALTAERDAALESPFELPSGQLATARILGKPLLEAIPDTETRCLGIAAFEPKFPDECPFRMRECRMPPR